MKKKAIGATIVTIFILGFIFFKNTWLNSNDTDNTVPIVNENEQSENDSNEINEDINQEEIDSNDNEEINSDSNNDMKITQNDSNNETNKQSTTSKDNSVVKNNSVKESNDSNKQTTTKENTNNSNEEVSTTTDEDTNSNANNNQDTAENEQQTCTPKKFDMSWIRADFETFDECKAMGDKYLGTYGYYCHNFVDDCGTRYYMLTLFDGDGTSIDYHNVPIN